jgi:tRNA A-37 threonylcarbamoyl transferase component Bud32
MEQRKYERFFESKVLEYNNLNSESFVEGYVGEIYENEGSTGNSNLDIIFSYFHTNINNLLKYLNDRIHTEHYTAHESRELIYWTNEIKECRKFLSNSKYSFKILSIYESLIYKKLDFLEQSGGSPIPENFEKIELQFYEPIFYLESTIKIVRDNNIFANSTLIGHGSYANVYKYKDEFYDKWFALKKAKKDLNEKELERFRREFDFMKGQNNPYILEVYKYHENNSYTMELADCTLDDFITKNNTKLTNQERIKLILQIFKAFRFIEKQRVLHRDISTTNILIKNFNDIRVVKLSDFGLVKIEKSKLTSIHTEFKGSFNDPQLEIEGFSNYKIIHETFALTRLIFFVLTGKTNFNKIQNLKVEKFVSKGLSKNYNERYQSINDIFKEFKKLAKNL